MIQDIINATCVIFQIKHWRPSSCKFCKKRSSKTMSGCTDPTSISYSPLAMMMRNNCWSKSQIFPNNEVEFIYLCYLLLTEKTKKDTKLQLL